MQSFVSYTYIYTDCVMGYILEVCIEFVKGIWYIERVINSVFFRERPIFHHTCATCSELPSYVSTINVSSSTNLPVGVQAHV